ncbi:MAG: cation-translocating P-type ATPase [Clostridia bacterium]
MEKRILKLNSIPFLWVSGLALLTSFILEYIFPILSIDFTFFINPAIISLLISGTPLAYYAIQSIKERVITSAILITIAMIAAVYIGDIFAAGEIAFIMAIGEFLEEKTVEKAKQGIEKLLNLVPSTGRRITKTSNGEIVEQIINSEQIAKGDILRIFPGESFSADGVIIDGSTTVDQSIITGESLPIDKITGDEVFTGTINRFGSVDIEVTKSFENSSLQKMIKLVENADNNKAPTQRIVDKWAGYLVPAACVIAIITYIIIAFFLNQPDIALVRAVTVLVVFCPCALSLATPTSIMAAVGHATKNGVLIKSGEALERMGNINVVAFDKTGTLTHGKLEVSDIIPLDCDENSLITLAYAVESRSEHPIGKATVNYARTKGLTLSSVENFEMIVGKGVLGNISGEKLLCGNEKLITENSNAEISDQIQEKIANLRKQGKAVIIVACDDVISGLIGLSDKLKDTSAKSIEKLNSAGIQKTVLLTGDNEQSANFISEQIGITDVYSSLLPEDKVHAINEMSVKYGDVCMVGDGVNDAPALKTASVGIAMGTMGSDIAIDAADIAIMGDDISKISYIKKLSNATIFSIKFNITLSMAINIVAIILSVTGILTPTTGALVHNAGSVLVVLNAAKLYDKNID